MATVSMRHIGKIYRGGIEAVKDLNLEITDGEFLCLLGPSGCGKSTTMRMVAGLEDISSGEMYIGGTLVNDLSPRERDIAMSFENYALYPNMTIYENIAFPLEIRKMNRAEIEKKVFEVAELLDIRNLLREDVKGLSGGVQQRVGVARALVRNPKALILDEPISHLEEELKARMREELRRIQRKLGVTTLYVTHDQIEAMVMADRIAIMNFGVLQQVDTPENVFRNPANVFVGGFIGEPPMNFIKCRISGGAIVFDGLEVRFAGARAEKITQSGTKEIILGVRHTHMIISREARPDYMRGKVFFIEPRNEEMLLTLSVGTQRLLVTVPVDVNVKIGEDIYAAFDYDKCSFFDADTERNLL
ncbi:MAG: ABC transporter ATP-binding protein [Treponema sp.]|jgi:multiple sugar transport system ATP-binding protein|nr:ABC transporter ATP-binding protein [Treponema sp.]